MKLKYEHVQIDLETLDTQPGGVILSIGAVLFDPKSPVESCLGPEFYCVIKKQSCLDFGLTVSEDTLGWWEKQSAEAQTVLGQATIGENAFYLPESLKALAKFLPVGVKVWSNGANFDQPLLDVAYFRAGIPLPWKYYNSRCYRTIKGLCSKEDIKALEPEVVCAHNALEDAKWQAKHMVAIGHKLGLEIN